MTDQNEMTVVEASYKTSNGFEDLLLDDQINQLFGQKSIHTGWLGEYTRTLTVVYRVKEYADAFIEEFNRTTFHDASGRQKKVKLTVV